MKEWFKEEYYLYFDDSFYTIEQAEKGYYEYTWSNYIDSGSVSSYEDIEDLTPVSANHLFQCAFGVEENVLVYINIPSDKPRWGTEKKPSRTSSNFRIGWIDYNKSPYEDPSLEYTEFFLMKDTTYEYPRFTAYNPTKRRIKPKLNFIINRLKIKKITEEEYPELLEKLQKKLIPYRPLTLIGIEK